jgi:hypothetical protein
MVKMLFQKGADILRRAEGSNSLPSTFARNNYHDDVTKWLSTEEQNTEVYRAATCGDAQQLEELLTKPHVDLSWKMQQLESTKAQTNPKYPPLKNVLVEKGLIQGSTLSKLDTENENDDDSSVILTAEEKQSRYLEMAKAGAQGIEKQKQIQDVDQCNCNSALMQAALHGYLEVVQLLLNHKACNADALNCVNSYGQTALSVACHYRRSDIAILLSKMRAVDLDKADQSGLAPIHIAVSN